MRASQRPGDGDNQVELSERYPLKQFVRPVPPAPAGKSVNGRDRPDSQAARNGCVHHVGAIAVRVHDVRMDLAAE